MVKNEDQIKDEEVVEDQSQDEAQVTDQEEIQNEEVQEQEEEQLEDEQEEVEEEAPEQTQQQADEQPSRRETLRIQSLLKKYGPPQERQAPQQNGVDFRSMIDADDSVYEQLENATKNYGNQVSQEGLKQLHAVQFNTRLEVDTPKVLSRHPQLDPQSDDFNPAVAASFNEMYLSAVGYDEVDGSVTNPNLRYADYIDGMFELVEEAASRKIQTSTRNITRQAARTGLRPDGSSAARLDLTKDPASMTDKELDAMLAKNGLAPKSR